MLNNLEREKKIEQYKILNDKEEISCGTEEYIDNSNENILKIFISIFYYEKNISSNISKIFSKTQNFYLINPDWLIEFKNNYNYEKIYELLSNYDKSNKIEYSNLDQNMNDLLLYSKNKIKIDKIELSDNLMNNDYINPPLLKNNNIIYYDKFHIIPFEIMNSIKENILGSNITVEPKEIFLSKDNYIYILDSLQIYFWKIDDKLLFTIKYIFSYDSINIFNQEKEIINSTSIIEYIQQRKCNQNGAILQDLLDNESSKKIGKFINLNNNSIIEGKEKDINKDDNPIKKGIIEKKINSNIKINLVEKRKVSNNGNSHKSKKIIVKKREISHIIDGNKSIKNISISSYNSQKNIHVSYLKEKNDLNNHKALKNKKNESKVEKINKNKSILSEKKESIKKIKNELEIQKLNNNEIEQNKIKLLNEKEKEINAKEKEINKKELEIKNKEQELENREKEINIKEKEIKCKEEEIGKKEKEINNKKEELELKKKWKKSEKNNLEKGIQKLKINENRNIKKYDNKLKEKHKIINEKLKENKKIQIDLENKKNEISKLNKDNKNIKLNYENEIKTLNKNLNLKIGNLEKNLRELKSKNEELIQNEKDCKKKIEEYENKIKIFENDNKLKQISEKEEEINNKISFLEDKENLIEKEMIKLNKEKIENQRIKQENNNLIKEIEEKQKIYKQILSNIEEIKKKQNLNNINKNFNSVNENQILSLKNEYEEEPILVGLNNIGATCFMNSVLQCLSQTKPLTDFFLNEKNIDRIFNNNIQIKNKNDLQLSPAYYELIKQLWDKKQNKSFSPNNFMNQIEKMNPLFKQGQAGDSKDFINFIFEQLHKELKRPIRGANQDNIQPLNQYDRNNAFNYFFNEFKKECSIISDFFFGFNETTNECLNCKKNFNSKGYNSPICYNYGIFNCLIFPLEEIKKMKYNNIQNNIVSIYECFLYQQKSEIFTGENRNYCNICKQVFDSIYTSKIYIGPNILVLILNRGKGNIYDVKLEFSETINITQFVLQRDKPQLIYNLYGVITHIGQSGPNAHFVASCKSSINNKWYRFNDAFISPLSNIRKEVIEFGTPYILFYQKQ